MRIHRLQKGHPGHINPGGVTTRVPGGVTLRATVPVESQTIQLHQLVITTTQSNVIVKRKYTKRITAKASNMLYILVL